MPMIDNIVPFSIPKKPRIKERDPIPDQRKLAVIPIRACTDRRLSEGMMRALILICSYCNRAGITWVGQAKLAEQLKVSQQAISKQVVKLTKLGYLEVVWKAKPGERMNTWRVIYDPSISAQDAITITSTIEDTRPPVMQKIDQKAMEEPVSRAGQQRIAKLMQGALKSVKPQPKEYTMPTGNDTLTVKKMKAEIAKKRQSKGIPIQPPEVVAQAVQQPVDNYYSKSDELQPGEQKSTTSEGCTKHRTASSQKVIRDIFIKRSLNVLNNQNEELLIGYLTDLDFTVEQIEQAVDDLLAASRREGVEPPKRLDWWVNAVIEYQSDATARHLEGSGSPAKP